jgi:hypothetical protein
MMLRWSSRLVLLTALIAAAAGCRKKDEAEQIGETVGEAMSSLDESVAGESSAALLPFRRVPDGLKGSPWQRAMDDIIPSAYAATCWERTFSACDPTSAPGVRTKDFGGCMIGGATLEGTVTLTFKAPLCAIVTAGDAVTRTADFTLTGRYGGTLEITSPGGGQTLTKTADGFEYSVGGMERVLTTAGGRTLFDVATRTTAPIVVTGSSRADLKIVSGSFEIDHKIAGYKVTLTPDNLTWTSQCNCASSGTLNGTVSGGKHDGKSASVMITGCGEADVTIDGETESVSMDRCSPM